MRVGGVALIAAIMTKKKTLQLKCLFRKFLARPERFERPTPWFVAKYSIQLSYGRAEEDADYTDSWRKAKRFCVFFSSPDAACPMSEFSQDPLALARVIDLDSVPVVGMSPSDERADEHPLLFGGFVFSQEVRVVLRKLLLFPGFDLGFLCLHGRWRKRWSKAFRIRIGKDGFRSDGVQSTTKTLRDHSRSLPPEGALMGPRSECA